MSGLTPEIKQALYFGFPTSERLLADLEMLFRDADDSVKEKSDALAKAIKELLDASMHRFFVKPLDLLGVDSAGEKIVKIGVKTVKSVIRVLVRSLVHRMSEDEIKLMIQYIDGMLYRVKGSEGSNAYFAAPLDSRISVQLDRVTSQLGDESESCDATRKQFMEILLDITHSSVSVFLREPLTLLNLSIITSKVAHKAVDSTERAINKVITKVFDALSNDQLLALANYVGSLRVSCFDFELRNAPLN